MNIRIKNKIANKRPSTKDRMKFYRGIVKELRVINSDITNKNDELFNKSTELSCEIVKLRRANRGLADKIIELAKANTGLEREINLSQEMKMEQKKQIEQQEGEITLLKYRVDKYKEQMEQFQKPLWKKVLKK